MLHMLRYRSRCWCCPFLGMWLSALIGVYFRKRQKKSWSGRAAGPRLDRCSDAYPAGTDYRIQLFHGDQPLRPAKVLRGGRGPMPSGQSMSGPTCCRLPMPRRCARC